MAIAFMTIGTMFPMAVYTGKILLQVEIYLFFYSLKLLLGISLLLFAVALLNLTCLHLNHLIIIHITICKYIKTYKATPYRLIVLLFYFT